MIYIYDLLPCFGIHSFLFRISIIIFTLSLSTIKKTSDVMLEQCNGLKKDYIEQLMRTQGTQAHIIAKHFVSAQFLECFKDLPEPDVYGVLHKKCVSVSNLCQNRKLLNTEIYPLPVLVLRRVVSLLFFLDNLAFVFERMHKIDKAKQRQQTKTKYFISVIQAKSVSNFFLVLFHDATWESESKMFFSIQFCSKLFIIWYSCWRFNVSKNLSRAHKK